MFLSETIQVLKSWLLHAWLVTEMLEEMLLSVELHHLSSIHRKSPRKYHLS